MAGSALYAFGGRTDAYLFNDDMGSTVYALSNMLISIDLSDPFPDPDGQGAPYTQLELTVYDENYDVVSTDPTPRWGAGGTMANSLLYSVGGIAGTSSPFSSPADDATIWPLADTFLAIDTVSGDTSVLPYTGGPTDPANAPNGLLQPIVFTDSLETIVYVYGGMDYVTRQAFGGTLYAYDINGYNWDGWTTFTFTSAPTSVSWCQFVNVANGVVVQGGNNGSATTSASFVIDISSVTDASSTPTLTVSNSTAPDGAARQSGALFVLGSTALLVGGATHENLTTSISLAYFNATIQFGIAAKPTGAEMYNQVGADTRGQGALR